jgi:hypothetical protein
MVLWCIKSHVHASLYIIIYIVFYIYMCVCGKPWVKGCQQRARNPWLSVLANEDQTAWGWKRTCDFLNCWTSCRIHYFAIIACEWRGAKPSTPTPWFYFSTVATICIFAETMSPTVFVIISPSHVADCILIILPCHVADVLLESGLNSVGQYWMFYFGFEKYYKSL